MRVTRLVAVAAASLLTLGLTGTSQAAQVPEKAELGSQQVEDARAQEKAQVLDRSKNKQVYEVEVVRVQTDPETGKHRVVFEAGKDARRLKQQSHGEDALSSLKSSLRAAPLAATDTDTGAHSSAEKDCVPKVRSASVQNSVTAASACRRYGRSNPHDSNNYAPEYYNLGRCYNNVLGRAFYYYDASVWYGPHVWYIRYDKCEMNRFGAGPNDWKRLRAHERDHTRGWGHYEGRPRCNAAYNPSIRICRC